MTDNDSLFGDCDPQPSFRSSDLRGLAIDMSPSRRSPPSRSKSDDEKEVAGDAPGLGLERDDEQEFTSFLSEQLSAAGQDSKPNNTNAPHMADESEISGITEVMQQTANQPLTPLRHRNADAKSLTSTRAVRNLSLLPPPIDVRRARAPRTTSSGHKTSPYPRSVSGSGMLGPRSAEAHGHPLILFVKGRRGAKDRTRTVELLLPAASQDGPFPVSTGGGAVRYVRDYDDHTLALQLRDGYGALVGTWYKALSARTLRGIAVTGPRSRRADRAYEWLNAPGRRPGAASSRGVKEDELLSLFREPGRSRARFAWVRWARNLCEAAEPAPVVPLFNLPPSPCSPRNASQQQSPSGWRVPSGVSSPGVVAGDVQLDVLRMRRENEVCGDEDGGELEGLQFVVSWSVGRIVAVLAVIVSLAIAAALLWIFLGPRVGETIMPAASPLQKDRRSGVPDWNGAGERVAAGVELGIAVLLVGMTGFGGWIAASWPR